MLTYIRTENYIIDGEYEFKIEPKPNAYIIGAGRNNYKEWEEAGHNISYGENILWILRNCFKYPSSLENLLEPGIKNKKDPALLEIGIQAGGKNYKYHINFYEGKLFIESLMEDGKFVFFRDVMNDIERNDNEFEPSDLLYLKYWKGLSLPNLSNEACKEIGKVLEENILTVPRPSEISLPNSYGYYDDDITVDLMSIIQYYDGRFGIDTRAILSEMLKVLGFDNYDCVSSAGKFRMSGRKHLEMDYSTAGTGLKRLCILYPLLWVAREKGYTLLIPHLDSGLHVLIAQYLLEWFCSSGTEGRQLLTKVGNYENYRWTTNK